MAESNSDDSWWGWLQTAKEKVVTQSSEVLEFVKNDIDEFTKVVSEETSSMVSTTASALKNKLKLDEEDSAANNVKKTVGGFLSHVADVFTPPPDDGDEEAFVINNQQPVMLSRLQANIYTNIQTADTFLKEPSNETDYNTWLETFDMESKQVEMADLLVTCKPLHKQFTNLVPTQVSHSLFWHRYFYLVHCMEQKEEKRKEISKRATEATKISDEDTVWEDDEVLTGDVDIPEEIQTKLLQEYEEELLSASSSSEQLEEVEKEESPKKPAEDKSSKKKKSGVAVQQPKSIIDKKSKAKNEQPKSTAKTANTSAKSTKPKAASNNTKSKKPLDKPTSTASSSKSVSPNSSPSKSPTSDSNEDEWEKVEAESDSGIITIEDDTPVSEEGEKKKEDWETWE